eukprot:CAMPEP_0115740216 /NCGR_PEP_ID=MMETSP0272-20121206/89367_1 /TAXON_ID=71861 /ORGANISM="Scrippsiella trochoidea, Strain CCMP3099" /LENGTH=146 /DNA_ID=CAMNT_0003184839 /DNA_START=252 /DNA_END=693 /DNA_ORIENTATION=+
MAEAVVANAEVDARPIHAPNVFGDEAVLLPLSDAAAGSVVVAHRVHKVEGASIEHPDIDPWAPRERIADAIRATSNDGGPDCIQVVLLELGIRGVGQHTPNVDVAWACCTFRPCEWTFAINICTSGEQLLACPDEFTTTLPNRKIV